MNYARHLFLGDRLSEWRVQMPFYYLLGRREHIDVPPFLSSARV